MRWLRFAAFILVVTIIQASMISAVAVTRWNIKPNLLIVFLVFFAIFSKTTDAVIAAFVIGFAADLIGTSMGPNTLSFLLVGTALAYISRVIVLQRMAYQAVAISVAVVLAMTVAHWLELLKGLEQPANPYRIILLAAIYSAIVGPFFFLPAAWWMRIRNYRL